MTQTRVAKQKKTGSRVKTETPAQIQKSPHTDNGTVSSEVLEAPRYSCALGGAYSTAVGLYGTVPILHSGAGCGIGQLFGQFYGGGQNAGGPVGGTSTPCSSLIEQHVVFGGEEKLRNLIASSSELVNGEFYAVISGCIPSLIGDDIDSVVREFRDKLPIISVKTAGFAGNSYRGYELFFESLIDQFLKPRKKVKGQVNIFGVVPYQHLFWKGDLDVIRELLESIGLKPNILFTRFDSLEALSNIPAAEYNIVLSPWVGHGIAEKLKEKFKTPFIAFPGVPIGPKQSSEFLRVIGEKLNVPSKTVEKVIAERERRAYRFTEYLGDILILVRPHAYFSVVADSSTAISITKFLANEIGYLPDIVQIADNPPEDKRDLIRQELTETLETPVKPEIVFETDAYRIRENLKNRNSLFLFASSLEAPISLAEFGAIPLTVAFPSFDRLVLERTYAGYKGGLTLAEDFMSKFAGPL